MNSDRNDYATTPHEQRHLEDAVSELKACIRLQPRHGEAHGNLALCLYELGRGTEAASIIEAWRAFERMRELPNAHPMPM